MSVQFDKDTVRLEEMGWLCVRCKNLFWVLTQIKSNILGWKNIFSSTGDKFSAQFHLMVNHGIGRKQFSKEDKLMILVFNLFLL